MGLFPFSPASPALGAGMETDSQIYEIQVPREIHQSKPSSGFGMGSRRLGAALTKNTDIALRCRTPHDVIHR